MSTAQKLEFLTRVQCELSAGEFGVLFALSTFMDGDGCGAWPSQSTLAGRVGMSGRMVRKHLCRLEELGVLVRGDQRLAAGSGARRKPVVWNLNYRFLSTSSDIMHGIDNAEPGCKNGTTVPEQNLKAELSCRQKRNQSSDDPSIDPIISLARLNAITESTDRARDGKNSLANIHIQKIIDTALVPDGTRHNLVTTANRLLRSGTHPEHVEAALETWLKRYETGQVHSPGLLPHLANDYESGALVNLDTWLKNNYNHHESDEFIDITPESQARIDAFIAGDPL